MEEIIPDQNGLPPKKASYSSDEKSIIVAKAAEEGIHKVADAYGMDWHVIASWKRVKPHTTKVECFQTS